MTTSTSIKPRIGFVGQGFIGKNYADDFVARGYSVTRYAQEPEYVSNKDAIKECDIVFIAVPTPTTPQGFDDHIVRSVIKLVGVGKTAVIKSTLIPGTTASIQKENPDIFVFHSPEFLTEVTASKDAAHPLRNIVGSPIDSPEYKKKAAEVIAVLPKAPYELICTSEEAELIKYGGNCFLYSKVIYMNMLYDYAASLGCNWDTVADAMIHDPRIGASHMKPHHASGRGAGGNCFIKDFEAFIEGYKEHNPRDAAGIAALEGLKNKNYNLLKSSGKDLGLLKGVTGE
jgi:UDPglucose 6-dehydrogenase